MRDLHSLRRAFRLAFWPGENAFVLAREDLDELGKHLLPAFENPARARAAGGFGVAGDQGKEHGRILGGRFEIDALWVAALGREVAVLIEHEGQTAAHAG